MFFFHDTDLVSFKQIGQNVIDFMKRFYLFYIIFSSKHKLDFNLLKQLLASYMKKVLILTALAHFKQNTLKTL